MHYFALSLLAAAAAAATGVCGLQTRSTNGCGKALPSKQVPGGTSQLVNFTQTDGTKRQYLIHIPTGYVETTPAPLIFSFHGRTKNACEQEGLSQFSNPEFNNKSIAVYPQGLGVGLLFHL